MPQTSPRDYQPIPDMVQETTVSKKSFNVCLSGRTNDAHLDFVRHLTADGVIQGNSPEQSDYQLVFCPIASRVGTDISEALDNIQDGKPVILVVMHHTFNPDHVVALSRRQVVDNPNVVLTVDCLFYEGHFLKCTRNDIAWGEVQTFLGVPPQHRTWKDKISILWRNNWPIIVGVFAVAVVIVVIILVVEKDQL